MPRKSDDKQRLYKLRGLHRKRRTRDGQPALCAVRTAAVDKRYGKNTERKHEKQPPQPSVHARERHTGEQQHSRSAYRSGCRLYPYLGYALRSLERTRADRDKHGKDAYKRERERCRYYRAPAKIISAQVGGRRKTPERVLLSGDAPPGAAVGAALVGAIIFHSFVSVSQLYRSINVPIHNYFETSISRFTIISGH